MRTRCLRTLMMGLVLVGLLAGCATVGARQDAHGLPNADNPEYLINPFRLVALPTYVLGYMVQYAVEPLYFAMNTAPDAFGLSLEEQVYLKQRGEAWSRALGAQQVKPAP
jgi:hypothetical protein